ncbi:hypothetical protein [Tsukamurella tyrosinosolvens]|uniref:hypothetical protein n=1 Tax=Tsukamurella tyrosinosolvens TaxID=57704 RepID=UPI003B75D1AD
MDRDRPGRARQLDQEDHRCHVDCATEKPWCDPLVDSDTCDQVEGLAGVGGAGLAGVRDQAVQG